MRQYLLFLCLILMTISVSAAEPDFQADVLPVLRTYCLGCHNARDAEGGLVLEDHARMLKGNDDGPVLTPGKSADSDLWKVIAGQAEPRMPPKDSPQPKPEEIAVIKAWIDAGAKAPAKGSAGLVTPKIAPQGTVREPIVALAADPKGHWLAVARPAAVEIVSANNVQPLRELTGHTGVIADVTVSADGKFLVVAAGEIGLAGEATIWQTADWVRGPVISGHRDALYSAVLSPDANVLATASYDKEILAWNAQTGEPLSALTGHNDAVFSVAFEPRQGRFLASASGDRTVKLWDVASGRRLDTFSQPAKEQNSVAFSPSGQMVAAGGADNRIRIWKISESGQEGTNPIQFARFAHEGPVLKVLFSPDGRLLVSSSQDLRIKVWETQTFTQVALFDKQPDWSPALAISPDSRSLFAGRLDGSLSRYDLKPEWGGKPAELERLSLTPKNNHVANPAALTEVSEAEPNDTLTSAQAVAWPAIVRGSLSGKPADDSDLYRLTAKTGETWLLETNAARSGSAADTKLEVLHADGRPVLRGLLQAVRDSMINFRPIDSNGPDVRVDYWEEMDLNQLLYMNGEVVKLFRAPQGPDSAWNLYQNQGKRRGYFNTSATGQAKEQPVYIVEAYPPGSSIVENGLPVFPLYYLNDDDAERELGHDSRLTFTAPADGTYLIRVTDTRGFTGDNFQYALTVRPPQPDFAVKVETQNLKVSPGSGQRLTFALDRIDNFDGPVRLDVTDVPAGYAVASPIWIEAGHLKANGVITAAVDAQPISKDIWEQVQVLATAEINGQSVTKPSGHFGEITLEKPATIRVTLEPDDPKFTGEDGSLIIEPGTTVSARLKIERNNFDGEVRFDIDGLPHGVIVANLGLNGIMVRKDETERQIFITARPWVPATTHLINAVAQSQGGQASPAVRLQVK